MASDQKSAAALLGNLLGTRCNLTVAQLLLNYLRLESATKIFGVPGGAIIYVLDELRKHDDEFDLVVCRHETGAAYMADCYARVSDQLGVVLTTSGPSATNALTGAMNAQASNVSTLIITGEVPEKYFGLGYLQEGVDAKLDVAAIYRSAVESSDVVSNQSNFQTLFEQALRNARSLPGRTSHISLPNDVAGTCLSPTEIRFPNATAAYRSLPAGTDASQVRDTLAELESADWPLIFLGNGARRALASPARLAAFVALVERFAIPVMTTPDAKGIFPETHRLALRNYGMTPCAWPELYMSAKVRPEPYDSLLVLGSTLGELTTSPAASRPFDPMLIPTRHFTQVDLDQGTIGRGFPISRGIVGEIGATLDVLIAKATEQASPDPTRLERRLVFLEEIKRRSPFADPAGRASEAAPLHPAAAMRVANETLRDGHLFIDAGNCVGWSLNYLVVDPPLRYHAALNMGPMGFAVAGVVGGKIGDPAKPCVALVGDGAFMMHGAEVSTAAQNRVGAVWLVLYDNDLAMVSQGMADLFPPPGSWQDYYKLGAPDLVTFSQGLGAEAVAITREQGPEDLKRALEAALLRADQEARPQVIVMHIDPRPMPPYGWPHLPPPDCGRTG
jgi:acetolactate synthase I/II/III large subunit